MPRLEDIQRLPKELVELFKNVGNFTKVACVLLLTFSTILAFGRENAKYLCVIPGYILPPNLWLWTLLTCAFVEFSWPEIALDLLFLLLTDRLLRPHWSDLDTLLYFLFVNTTATLSMASLYLVLYASTSNEAYYFASTLHGLLPWVAAFAVALRQSMPERILLELPPPLGKFRNQHVALLMLLVYSLLAAFSLQSPSAPVLLAVAIYLSWLYLRFVQRHANKTIGDQSEAFTFAGFFPNHLRPPIAILSNTLWNLLVSARVCKEQPVRRYELLPTSLPLGGRPSVVPASGSSPHSISLPYTEQLDAERRRQLALRALQDRLAKMENTNASLAQWPSLVDVAPPSPQPPAPAAHTDPNSLAEVTRSIEGATRSPVTAQMPAPVSLEPASQSQTQTLAQGPARPELISQPAQPPS